MSIYARYIVQHRFFQVGTANDRSCNALVNAVFGDEGLSTCNDVVSFIEKAGDIAHHVLPTIPDQLRTYYERRVEPLLRINIECGCWGWTNNASESMNHVFKQKAEWKAHVLPDLVELLRSLVLSQYAEADRALCGLEDFRLAPPHSRHQVTAERWRTMSDSARHKLRAATFNVASDSRAGLVNVESTDGDLIVQHKLNAGRKTGQRRRPRA